MTEKPTTETRCTLYVHNDNARRCLVVSAGAPLPPHLDPSCWRLIAHGLPVNSDAEWALRKYGFYQYIAPAK